MSILYLEEHTNCSNYVSTFNNGFNHFSLNKAERIIPSSFDYNSILFVIKGRVTLYYLSEKYVLPKNTMAFIPTACNYEIRSNINSDIVINYFNNNFEFCEKFTLENLSEYCIENKFSTLPILNPLLKYFISPVTYLLENGARCNHFFEMKHNELLYMLRFLYKKEELASFFSPIIANNISFKTLVLSNYQKANSVKKLAELCNFSKSKFGREFFNNFGETPFNWLNRQRINLIKHKLMDKNISFASIIEELGFSSAAHFTSFCKLNFDKTPKELRRDICV